MFNIHITKHLYGVLIWIKRYIYLMHFFYAIGDSIDEREATAYIANLAGNGLITVREKNMISAALSGSALAEIPMEFRNNIRAQIFRHIILSIMR